MATEEKAPSATKRAAIEAATSKSPKVRVGEVVSLVVKSPSRPTFRVDSQPQAIHARRTKDSDAWTAAWIAPSEGEHNVTATADDADPVTFTVTATSQER